MLPLHRRRRRRRRRRRGMGRRGTFFMVSTLLTNIFISSALDQS
jgi:hypothetical protein